MVAFGSVCMIALFVLLSRATVSLSLPLVPPSLPADTRQFEALILESDDAIEQPGFACTG
jgi:hypothetical protein